MPKPMKFRFAVSVLFVILSIALCGCGGQTESGPPSEVNNSVRVVDYYSLSPLSDWVGVDQGQTKLIWTNKTGQTKYIRFELSSVWPWSIRAQGKWLFGPF